jgi:hypothetical protein
LIAEQAALAVVILDIAWMAAMMYSIGWTAGFDAKRGLEGFKCQPDNTVLA